MIDVVAGRHDARIRFGKRLEKDMIAPAVGPPLRVGILADRWAGPIADGRLIRLLEPWCDPFPGYHLYHPNRKGTMAFELFKAGLRESRRS